MNDQNQFYVTKLRAKEWHVIDYEGFFVSNAPYPTKREALEYARELTTAAKNGALLFI